MMIGFDHDYIEYWALCKLHTGAHVVSCGPQEDACNVFCKHNYVCLTINQQMHEVTDLSDKLYFVFTLFCSQTLSASFFESTTHEI